MTRIATFREIGSDYSFSLDAQPLYDPNADKGAQWRLVPDGLPMFVDSGRSAIRVALRVLGVGDGDCVLLPAYICDSVRHAVLRENAEPVAYSVDATMSPSESDVLVRITPRVKAIIVLDYFGFPSPLEAVSAELDARGVKVVFDITHSLITRIERPLPRVSAYVGSLRKLLPLPDGGIVGFSSATAAQQDIPALASHSEHAGMRTAAMLWKEMWLQRPRSRKPPFREIFLQAESILDGSYEMAQMSEISRVILPMVNVRYVAERRRTNWTRLLGYSSSWGEDIKPLFGALQPGEVPLGFPVLATERDSLRAFLNANGVFAPVHWPIPEAVIAQFPETARLSRQMLTLPCDHRYTVEDMDRINELITRWVEKRA